MSPYFPSLLVATTLLVALAHPLKAQSTLTGTVQNAQGSPVPFAILELPAHKLGVQADNEGHFSLPLPTALATTDSLTVSALGYVRRHVPVPAGATATLQLVALPVSLNEVVVRGTRAAPVVLGLLSGNFKETGFGQSGLSPTKHTGWQVARFFAPPAPAQLTEVSFFIKKNASSRCSESYRAPFRVRVYAVNDTDQSPGTDLLLTSVLVAATKPGWLTVDLRKYQLQMPTTGFYVAMEWVYTDEQYLCVSNYIEPTTKQRKQHIAYGQHLGGQRNTNQQTWYLASGYPWQRTRVSQMPNGSSLPPVDASIRATVQP